MQKNKKQNTKYKKTPQNKKNPKKNQPEITITNTLPSWVFVHIHTSRLYKTYHLNSAIFN